MAQEPDGRIKLRLTLLGLLSLGIVTLVDYLTGPDARVNLLFVVPVLLLTRGWGSRGGVLTALLSAGLSAALSLTWAPGSMDILGPTVGNAVFRGVMLVFVAVLFGRLLGLNTRLDQQVREKTTALEADIADRKRAEAAVRESEELYRSLFENLLNGFAYCRMIFEDGRPVDFTYLAVNEAFETQTGLRNAVGRKVTEVIPGIRESDPRLLEIYGRVATTGQPERFEMFVTSLEMWFAIAVYCPAPGYFVAVFDVVTERKRAEDALRASLREKDALLKEVHHRVKNNLQLVTSLLRLESARSTNLDTRAALTETQGRVRSMALLHEALYRSSSFAAVDLSAYLRRLTNEMFRTLATSPGSVQLHLDLASVPIEMDQAMSCGLLINELLSNSLAHGFPPGRTGEIRVELLPVDDGRQLRLRVSDTGVGLPPDFTLRRTGSLGLQLVSDLAGQLGGSLEIGTGPTAVFTVTFPVRPMPATVMAA